ncbi:hypothetical protein D3C72_1486590 [compost metagenome]
MQRPNQRRTGGREEIADALRHAGQRRCLLRMAGAQPHERQPQNDPAARAQSQQHDPQRGPGGRGDQARERDEGGRRRAERGAALVLQAPHHRGQEQGRDGGHQLQQSMQGTGALGRKPSVAQNRGQPAHAHVEHKGIDAQVQRDLPGQGGMP